MVITAFTEIVPIKTNKDGVMLVRNTSVTVDTIVAAFNDGATAEENSFQHPSVPLADAYSVITYYLHHKKQVDGYIKHREKIAREIRKQNEARFDQ